MAHTKLSPTYTYITLDLGILGEQEVEVCHMEGEVYTVLFQLKDFSKLNITSLVDKDYVLDRVAAEIKQNKSERLAEDDIDAYFQRLKLRGTNENNY